MAYQPTYAISLTLCLATQRLAAKRVWMSRISNHKRDKVGQKFALHAKKHPCAKQCLRYENHITLYMTLLVSDTICSIPHVYQRTFITLKCLFLDEMSSDFVYHTSDWKPLQKKAHKRIQNSIAGSYTFQQYQGWSMWIICLVSSRKTMMILVQK